MAGNAQVEDPNDLVPVGDASADIQTAAPQQASSNTQSMAEKPEDLEPVGDNIGFMDHKQSLISNVWDDGGSAVHTVTDKSGTQIKLYQYVDPKGNEVFSREYPPSGSRPPKDLTGNDSDESDPFSEHIGKTLYKAASGVNQLAGFPVTGSQYMAGSQGELDSQKETDAKMAPSLAGDVVGNLALTAAAPGSILGQGLAQAALAGISATATGESRGQNAFWGGVGGMAGTAGGKLLGRAFQPVTSHLDPEGQAAADLLTSNGVPLDLSQSTGSKLLQSTKRAISDNPVLGESSFAQEQRGAFNKAVLAEAGDTTGSTKADPKTLAKVHKDITSQREGVIQRNPVTITAPPDPVTQPGAYRLEQWRRRLGLGLAPGRQLYDDLDSTLKNAEGIVSDEDMSYIREPVDRIMKSAGLLDRNGNRTLATTGTVNPSTFSSARTKVSGSFGTGSPDIMRFGGQIAKNLDAGLEAHIPVGSPDKGLFADAQRKIGNLQYIQKAVNDNNDIPPTALYRSVDSLANAYSGKTTRGVGDQGIVNLAQAGSRLLGEKVGNSGTAHRLLAQGALGAGVAAATGLATGDWRQAAEYGGIGFAAPTIGRYLLEGSQAPEGAGILSKVVHGVANIPRAYAESAATGAIHAPIASMLSSAAAKTGSALGASAFKNSVEPSINKPSTSPKIRYKNGVKVPIPGKK